MHVIGVELNEAQPSRKRAFPVLSPCRLTLVCLRAPNMPKESKPDPRPQPRPESGGYANVDPDPLKSRVEYGVPVQGMKIDLKFFEQFEDKVKEAPEVRAALRPWDCFMDQVC